MKWELMLIKLYMPRNIQLVYARVKAPITMMCGTITQKNTRRQPKIHFIIVVWPKIEKTETAKDLPKV